MDGVEKKKVEMIETQRVEFKDRVIRQLADYASLLNAPCETIKTYP